EGMLLLSAEDTRVVVRPSGTEPKLKCYLEVVQDVPAGTSAPEMATIRQHAGERLAQLKDELRGVLGQA
ncbi:MAG: phospho-sugar mutase, partial [Brachybacterium tyrofermentans]